MKIFSDQSNTAGRNTEGRWVYFHLINKKNETKMKENNFSFNRIETVITGKTHALCFYFFPFIFLGINNIKLTSKRFHSSAPLVCLVAYLAASAGLTFLSLWMVRSLFAAGASTFLISTVLHLALRALPVSYIIINTPTEFFNWIFNVSLCQFYSAVESIWNN